jgi:hypothetical protein
MTSRIGFGCPGIPTFARGEGRLYLSPNIDLPSPLAKFRRRVCQNRFLKLFQYINSPLDGKKRKWEDDPCGEF